MSESLAHERTLQGNQDWHIPVQKKRRPLAYFCHCLVLRILTDHQSLFDRYLDHLRDSQRKSFSKSIGLCTVLCICFDLRLVDQLHAVCHWIRLGFECFLFEKSIYFDWNIKTFILITNNYPSRMLNTEFLPQTSLWILAVQLVEFYLCNSMVRAIPVEHNRNQPHPAHTHHYTRYSSAWMLVHCLHELKFQCERSKIPSLCHWK